MLDQSFCEFLEYKITKIFSSSSDESLKGFWCDGILLSQTENEYSKEYVNENRQVLMTAFVGKTGQNKYELILQFGTNSLSRYQNNLRLEECVPNSDDNTWFTIDSANKRMLLQLD